MEISFKGKNVLVTGAGQGIGREIAKKLVKCGANVLAISRTKRFLDTLIEEEPTIKAVCLDLADWDATREVVQNLGPIHALVNNAAIAELEPFLEVTPGSFDRLFNVNVKSIINVSQIVAKGMINRKEGGSIVNLSSIAGKAGLANHSVYGATKGALEMLNKIMAIELGPYNIRVNNVNPTVVLTDMGKLGWSDPDKARDMIKKTPLGRFSEVDEVVNVVLFMLSDLASMCTGTYLQVDGGFLAG